MARYNLSGLPAIRIPVTYNGSNLEGQEVNSATTFVTGAINIDSASRVGLYVNIASEDGTGGTLDIDLEWSPDQGTTYVGMPLSANSETEATLAQFTATGTKLKWFEVIGDGEFCRIRHVIFCTLQIGATDKRVQHHNLSYEGVTLLPRDGNLSARRHHSFALVALRGACRVAC